MTHYPSGAGVVAFPINSPRPFGPVGHKDCAVHTYGVGAPRPPPLHGDISLETHGGTYPVDGADKLDTIDWLHYWTNWQGKWGQRTDGRLDADALADRLGDTVAAVSGPGSAEGRVEFDIFSGQTGGEWSSWCDVAGGVVTAGLIRLPSADSTVDTFVQLRNFLGDVPLVTLGSVATVYEDVPHLIFDTSVRDIRDTAPAGRWAALVEDIVAEYDGEDTAATLGQYPTTPQT